jgi:hypothetical protein
LVRETPHGRAKAGELDFGTDGVKLDGESHPLDEVARSQPTTELTNSTPSSRVRMATA